LKNIIYILSFLIIASYQCFSQETDRIVVFARIIDGDTVPIIKLPEINVYSFKIIKSKRKARKLSRLIKNVKKVYPYAKLAGIKLQEYNEIFLTISSEKEKRKLMRQVEKELKDEFGDELRSLTFSQGKILIKLIDRETGNSSFELVQELRGKFIAFFWQTFARIFGYNLKIKYDPEGEDKNIEIIVLMIENGSI
jgi:hypothetical protein